MDVQVERTGPVNCKLSVTIPAADVDEAFDRAYKKIGKSARVAGFRPGKAPRGVLEMHYGPQVREEVQNELVSGSLSKAVIEHKVEMVAQPRVDPGTLKKGSEFSYVAEIELRPEVELKQYKDLEIEKIEPAVDEDEISEELEQLRTQSAQLVPVMIRDVVEDGDLVLVDYVGSVGGVPIEGGSAEGAIIEIGGSDYLPGLSNGLLGAKVPSERQIPVDFPEDYAIERLRGKKASFDVKIKELKAKELPELDDDFAKDLGEESLDALKTKIREGIEAKATREAEGKQREAIMQALVDANPFEIPPSMVNEQADRMIIDAVSRVQSMMGPQFDPGQLNLSSLREENKARAEHTVRSGLLLLEVAKAENLEVDATALDAEITKIVDGAGEQAAQVRAYYADPKHRQELEYRLLEEKTMSFLLDNRKGAPATEQSDAADATEEAEPSKSEED